MILDLSALEGQFFLIGSDVALMIGGGEVLYRAGVEFCFSNVLISNTDVGELSF